MDRINNDDVFELTEGDYCGGTLSVRDVTDKQKMYIKLVQNEAAKYEE